VTTLQERVHGTRLPKNWQLNKLHRVLRARKGHKNRGMHESNLLSLSYGKIVNKDIDSSEGLLPESFETYQIVEPGDIIMRLSDLQNDKRSLRQALVHERGIITSAYDALEVSADQDPRFWAYALLALDIAKYYYSLGGGVRQSIKFSDFPNDWIAAPSLEIQRATSDFLDREIAKIEQLIDKKRQLIDLLAVKRASHIYETVTGRASKDAISKKTGNLWFPLLPDGWKLARIKNVVTSISDGPHISPEYVDEGIPFISARNVKVDRWSLDDAKYISHELYRELTKKSKPVKDDVLYTKGGTTGVARLVDLEFEFHIWVHVALLKIRRSVACPAYVAHALNSSGCYAQSQLFTRGATCASTALSRK
jgi:type I restriction enzyme S subunit